MLPCWALWRWVRRCSSTAVLAVACFAASHRERWPLFHVPAAATVLGGAILAASGLLEAVPGVWGRYRLWLAGPDNSGALVAEPREACR